MKAVWNGETIAESDKTIVVEGNHYFPVDTVKKGIFKRKRNPYGLPLERIGILLHN